MRKTYIAKPDVASPLLDSISKEALIAWFRCNSCLSCAFREQVVDPHPLLTTLKCSDMHTRHNIVDMVDLLGYTRE